MAKVQWLVYQTVPCVLGGQVNSSNNELRDNAAGPFVSMQAPQQIQYLIMARLTNIQRTSISNSALLLSDVGLMHRYLFLLFYWSFIHVLRVNNCSTSYV